MTLSVGISVRCGPAFALVLAAALAGCAFSVQNAPLNAVARADAPAPPRDIVGPDAIAVSLSGGGTRAAAFGLGVLKGLEASTQPGDDLVGDLTFLTSVSGGSLLAAHYGLHGRASLQSFRTEVLNRNMEQGMQFSAFKPDNIARFIQGGLNDRRHLSDYLDDTIFKKATFADMWRRRKPDVWINATDLYNRIPFTFIPPVFAAVCSDLASFPLAEAVSASMAVPVVFAPVVLRTYPDDCS
ncbi:MAG: phospholipase, partial [Burkholderiales bacterium PBB4]